MNELLWLIAGFSVGFLVAILIGMYAQYEHDTKMREMAAMNQETVRVTSEMLQALARYEDAKRDAETVSMN